MIRLVACVVLTCLVLGQSAVGQTPSKEATNKVLARELSRVQAQLNQMQADYLNTQNAIKYLNALAQGNPPPIKSLNLGFNDVSQLNPRDPAAQIKIQSRISELAGDLEQMDRQIKIVAKRVATIEKTLGVKPASTSGEAGSTGSLGNVPSNTIPQPTETTDSAQFDELVAVVAPRFTLSGSGEKGVALLAEHFGHRNVVRTHPIDRRQPSALRSKVDLPLNKRTQLVLDVSHHPRGNWQLIVRANGQELLNTAVSPKTTTGGWVTHKIDLSSLAGRRVDLEVSNNANNGQYEFAYWGRVEVVTP